MAAFKTRWLWVGWGPDIASLRGWELSILLFPRPYDAKVCGPISAALRLEVRRDGPPKFMAHCKNPGAVDSAAWTGLAYWWPPQISVTLG